MRSLTNWERAAAFVVNLLTSDRPHANLYVRTGYFLPLYLRTACPKLASAAREFLLARPNFYGIASTLPKNRLRTASNRCGNYGQRLRAPRNQRLTSGLGAAPSVTISRGRLAQRLERPVYTRKVLSSNLRSPTIRCASRGDVVQSVRTLPCHGRGREFESRRPRHFSPRGLPDVTPETPACDLVHFPLIPVFQEFSGWRGMVTKPRYFGFHPV
jgi:hypothetical protein